MKIKSQVYFLLSGILIIPVLFFVFIGLIRYFDAPERIFAPGYEDLLSTESISQQDWNKIRKYIENSPKNLRCAVVDKNNMVIFSVIPELQEGTILSENDLIQLMLNHRGNYVYQIDFPFKNIDTAPFVITQFSMEHKERPSIFVDIFWSGGLVLVFIFAFCAIMVFVILRSITKSVLALEEGTRRIADGEFDLELDLKGSNEITSLSYSINKMRQALRDDQFRKSRFIMGISHDLRTPIALIKGYAEAISDGTIDDTEMLKSSLEIICQKSQQLDDMIEDLLNFVKLNTQEWNKHVEVRSVYPLLEDCFHRLQSDGILLQRRITGSIDIPQSTLIATDEKLFIRVLENLTGNALRYTEQNGIIDFSACIHENQLCISVSDTGIGISQEDLPYIFDLFYRGTNSRREKGSGLGLAVVKSILESFRWNIEVFSQKGSGSCFVVQIPLVRGELP